VKLYHSKETIMSALDDLLGEFESNAGTMPTVNPPEAAKVLATQTAPEVAGEPEPPAQEEAPPAPTEKPADVKAAEAAKSRKRAPKPPAPSAAPEGWDSAPKPGPDGKLTTEQLVAELRDRGYNVTLTVGS
jgi:hypothetical protein